MDTFCIRTVWQDFLSPFCTQRYSPYIRILELYLSSFYVQQKKRASLFSSSHVIKGGGPYLNQSQWSHLTVRSFLKGNQDIVFKWKENWMLVIRNNQPFARDAVLFVNEMASSRVYRLMTDGSELRSRFWSLIAHLSSMPVMSLHSSRGLPGKAGLTTYQISLIIGLTVTRACLRSQLSSSSWLSPVLPIHQFAPQVLLPLSPISILKENTRFFPPWFPPQ